jgi:neutral ceramidase
VRVGAARIDITPPAGVELSGFGARVQPSTGVHDPLTAKALFAADDTSRLLWLHADLIGFQREFVRDVKAALRERLGLAEREVVLSATHTHSGPPTIHLVNCGAYDAPYVDGLRGKLLDVAERAMANTEPAEVVLGETPCRLAVNRRRPERPEVEAPLGVAGWRREDGTWVAAIANYPMHNVGFGAENRLISADIAGRAAAVIAEGVAGSPTVLMTNGACGDLNPAAESADYANVEQIGVALGEAAVRALEAGVPFPGTSLDTTAETLEIIPKPLSAREVEVVAGRLRARFAGQGYAPRRMRAAVDEWQRRFSGRQMPPVALLELQVVRIGPATFACFGAEVFYEMSRELRRQVGGLVWVVGYANGTLGYLAPNPAYDEGGYEVDSAFVFYGTPPVPRGGFERARERMVEMVRESLARDQGA